MDTQTQIYVTHNDLVVMCKSKVALMLSKPEYIGMWILELRKVLMCEFHYDCIKKEYGNNSRPLFD